MTYVDNVLSLIGNTPMVPLRKIFSDQGPNIFGKLESFNLTGSMKARSALGMIEAAEEKGELRPGMTIIESTSGNLGYGLAAIGSQKGYEVILVIDPKTDSLKRNILQAYGAKLIIVDKPDEQGAYQPTRILKVRELLNEIPNSWTPCQYHNEDNFRAHYKSTGPEIMNDLEGKVDVLIGAIGTCGHLGGSAKYIKEKNPDLRVIGIEPEGSVISGGEYKPYLIQGPGLSIIPKNYDPDVISEIHKISDSDAFRAARDLAVKESILSGASAGSVIHAAKNLFNTFKSGSNVVLILADDGFRYGTNFYDDNYLSTHGITPYKYSKD